MKKMPYSGMIYRKLQELYKKSPKIHPDSPKTFYHLFFIILLPFSPLLFLLFSLCYTHTHTHLFSLAFENKMQECFLKTWFSYQTH